MTKKETGSLLKNINYPADLRQLEAAQLPQVCDELRQFIIDTVSRYGGHFAAGLGVVELTVALHYVLNTPEDLLVWDVGHQAYGHKILTGRKDKFSTNRKWQGLSGFPKRSESIYDAFGTGHSSTSISAALGMAIASKLKGAIKKNHVAVIGDGALTAGLSFEALNHAGDSDANILIVFNDNNMSIDPVVGGLNHYMTDTRKSPSVMALKERLEKVLEKWPQGMGGDLKNKIRHQIANLEPNAGSYFESLGLNYFGPVDGHNIRELVKHLKALTQKPGPKILHVKTIKGKGYAPAEHNQTQWHATAAFDKITGLKNEPKANEKQQPPKYQDVFGKTILTLARQNPKIMGITPAMPTGGSLKYMIEEMPDRALDVGIAEQHAVTLSAGLATQGMKVFCNLYSTFAQRAFDMIIHDVAIQDLPVIFCLDRAGLVGADGATHQGVYDLAFLRCIPNIIVSAPMNEKALRNLMFTAQLDHQQHPFAIRYPRGRGVMTDWETEFEKIPIGKGRKIQDGQGIAILSIGHPGNFVVEACRQLARENIHPAHYDMRFVKPLDETLLKTIGQQFEYIITVENGCLKGGFGSAVLEFFNTHCLQPKVQRLGIPDEVIEQGQQAEQQAYCGINAKGIMEAVKAVITTPKN